MLTIGEGLGDLAPTTVSGLADVVYASTGAMYVTSTAWGGTGTAWGGTGTGWGGTGPVTFVHRFELPADGRAVHTGSGRVPGAPLSQYSLSEAQGDLRIVTTTEDATRPAGAPGGDAVRPGDLDASVAPPLPATEGRLAVLRPAGDGTLEEVGHLEDLGVGERVQSVRFIGPMAYVVTFRRTDPLYAIDLSDPTAPRALGELKITGFSEYLHSVGDGLLLGVGREATLDGMDTGLKASLFDVSDPTAPQELDKVVIEAADSPVGQDPLAFTWDPVGSRAVIPLHRWPSDLPVAECGPGLDCGAVAPAAPRSGALVLSVNGGRLEAVAELSHDDDGDPWRSEILRSVVVDRDLWTVSRLGLGRTDADSPSGVELLGW